MPAQISSDPRMSSEPSSQTQSHATSPRASTLSKRPNLHSNNSSFMSTIKKTFDGATADYWSQPSPLYTPRASIDPSRTDSPSTPMATAAATSSSAASTKKEKKAGIINKVKRAIDRNTEDYWGNAEMNAFYAPGLKI